MNIGLDIEQAEKDLHPVFKIDPLHLWKYVNKKVRLATSQAVTFTGWVYTIDPVTHNWILFSDSSNESLLVMNNFVTDITVYDESTCPANVQELMELYEQDIQAELSIADLKSRKDAICRWLGVHRVPVVRENELLSVANGTITIHPPYLPENCSSSNEIVLSRIQTLLKSMPETLDVLTDA